ncbi:MAG: ACT domain-containing protein [Bacteroidales bacterium]|jgi:hypothetical protein
MIMNFTVLRGKYSIYKFKYQSVLPDWIYSSDFYSVTKTKDELSVIALQTELISEDIVCSNDWKIFKIEGSLDFSLVGIIADISAILKEKKIPIFTISTYETDYILVKQKDLSAGMKALRDKGHLISAET